MAGLTLDTGALIAIDRGDERVRAWLELAFDKGQMPVASAVAVAEAWRDGATQVLLARMLKRIEVEDVDESLARRAGELMGRTNTDDPVDAIVAASAALRGDHVLTSDPGDMQKLADDLPAIKLRSI